MRSSPDYPGRGAGLVDEVLRDLLHLPDDGLRARRSCLAETSAAAFASAGPLVLLRQLRALLADGFEDLRDGIGMGASGVASHRRGGDGDGARGRRALGASRGWLHEVVRYRS